MSGGGEVDASFASGAGEGFDLQIVARVASVQNTYQWAKAGVMIRGTLSPDSTNALMAIAPSGSP